MQQEPVAFISHSSLDSDTANLVCQALEQHRIRCWIAPRDIPGGASWDDAIIKGIDASRVVVLIFSSHANESMHVKRELHRAFEKRKLVIPLRIEDVDPGGALEFILIGVQILDAFDPPLENHLAPLIERVSAIVNASAPPRATTSSYEIRPSETRPPSGRAGAYSASAQAVAAQPAAETPSLLKPRAPAQVLNPALNTNLNANLDPERKTLRVALLYKRSAQPDDHVLSVLESGLRSAGHEVFVDRHLRIGVEWAREIERQVRESDAVIPLLSAASVQSEMLGMEVQIASDAALQQFGKPRILPVRVNYPDGLPEPFYSILGQLQYHLWSDPRNDVELLTHLLDSLVAREQPKLIRDETPGGAVPLESPYYIVQPSDLEFHAALDRQDSIVLVKGARQMGKTSLLARGLQQARKAGKTVALADFQKLNQVNLADIESLYKGLGAMIADQLNLDVFPEDVWRAGRAPSVNFERYIRREILDKTEGHLILAMDEVDRLFPCSYASEVFGLFRSWHNERAVDPDGPWKRLTIAIVYATEAHLFITDQNQSPFNVGTRLELHDFGIEQVEKLNHLYKDPIQSPEDLKRFYALLNGQPYLTRRGFYELTNQGKSVDRLIEVAESDEGPFGDHLRRILVLLARDEKLLEVVRNFVHGQPIPDPTSFYRLRSGGLIVGGSAQDAKFRCNIYRAYLARHLA
jgi:hypothetical protein